MATITADHALAPSLLRFEVSNTLLVSVRLRGEGLVIEFGCVPTAIIVHPQGGVPLLGDLVVLVSSRQNAGRARASRGLRPELLIAAALLISSTSIHSLLLDVPRASNELLVVDVLRGMRSPWLRTALIVTHIVSAGSGVLMAW